MITEQTEHAEAEITEDEPIYRVQFWDMPVPDTAWQLDAFIVFGVTDVAEVVEWAAENSGGRRFEIFVEAEENTALPGEPRNANLIRLAGKNPNLPEDDSGPFVYFIPNGDL